MNFITDKCYQCTFKKDFGFSIHVAHFKKCRNCDLMLFVYLLDWRKMCILAHVYFSFIEVDFQFPRGEGKRAKLLPAAASFRSLVHFRLRVYVSTHSILHSMPTMLIHCAMTQ